MSKQIPDIDMSEFCKAADAALGNKGFRKLHAPVRTESVPRKIPQIEICARVDCYYYPTPSEGQMAAAKSLAATFGLTVDWWECEKGWGDFVFRAPEEK